jgi:hypothetical protein
LGFRFLEDRFGLHGELVLGFQSALAGASTLGLFDVTIEEIFFSAEVLWPL